jgi:hypothetical protein
MSRAGARSWSPPEGALARAPSPGACCGSSTRRGRRPRTRSARSSWSSTWASKHAIWASKQAITAVMVGITTLMDATTTVTVPTMTFDTRDHDAHGQDHVPRGPDHEAHRAGDEPPCRLLGSPCSVLGGPWSGPRSPWVPTTRLMEPACCAATRASFDMVGAWTGAHATMSPVLPSTRDVLLACTFVVDGFEVEDADHDAHARRADAQAPCMRPQIPSQHPQALPPAEPPHHLARHLLRYDARVLRPRVQVAPLAPLQEHFGYRPCGLARCCPLGCDLFASLSTISRNSSGSTLRPCASSSEIILFL